MGWVKGSDRNFTCDDLGREATQREKVGFIHTDGVGYAGGMHAYNFLAQPGAEPRSMPDYGDESCG